jgi:hypothetical protein
MNMLTPLESAALERLLDRPGEGYEFLRQQLPRLTVADRKFTGIGFFTHFALYPSTAIQSIQLESPISGAAAELPGLEHRVGFLLFLQEGAIHTLEGYTHGDDVWPERTDEFRVFKLTD